MREIPNSNAIPPAHSVVTLQGISRQVHGFTAFPLTASLRGAGIFVIVRPPEDVSRCAGSYWAPLYIGDSQSMGDAGEMPRGVLEQARRMGATHVLVHFCDRGEDARRSIVKDLIAALRPPLNSESRRAAA